MRPLHIARLTLSLLMPGVAPTASDNQRCFYDTGQLAPDYVIPCYSSFNSKHFSCCKLGNKCLEHGACYDAGTGITYQYGCTDENYQDANCPKKCDLDRKVTNWVGLVYCDGENNLPNNTWLCHHPFHCGGNCGDYWDPKLQSLPPTTCKDLDTRYIAFEAPSTLSDLLALPVSTGLRSYFSAHPIVTAVTSSESPAATSTTSDQSRSAVPSAATSSSPSATTISLEISGAPVHNSTSHTVAMAVGFGAGIPIILGLAGFLLYYFRRRRNQSRDTSVAEPVAKGYTDDGGGSYAHKAELSAEGRPLSEMPGSPGTIVSEMDGSTIGGRSPGMSQSPFISPIQSDFPSKSHKHMSDMHDGQLHELSG